MAKIAIKKTDLEKLITESIKKHFNQINEISADLMGAAAIKAAKKAEEEEHPSWKNEKYRRQAARLAQAAAGEAASKLGLELPYLNPRTGDVGGSFYDSNKQACALINRGDEKNVYYDADKNKITPQRFYGNLSITDLRRYGRAEDEVNSYYNKAQKYIADMYPEKELNENSIRAIVAEALKNVISSRLNEGIMRYR